MPIIRAKNIEETELTYLKDKFRIVHAQEIDHILKKNQEDRKDENNGFTKDRSYRKIASVPFLTWLEWTKQEPELIHADSQTRNRLLKKRLTKNPLFKSASGGI